jgi:3-isopropylmalate/(R)-2-methylmalate dehydratase small subunit
MNWNWQGKAWVFGDDVSNDDGIMPLAMTRQQEYDPSVLARHCFEMIDPRFADKALPRDIVVAGRNFGHGNPHIQGFLGLKGAGVGLVVESMSRGALRACINAGVPVLRGGPLGGFCRTGDLLEVDYETGALCNLTTGDTRMMPPMPAIMREIVDAGGGIAHMVRRLHAQGEKNPL